MDIVPDMSVCPPPHSSIVRIVVVQVMEKLDKVETGLRTVATSGSGGFQQRRRSSSRSRHSKRSNIDNIEEEAEHGDASSTSTSTEEEDHLLDEERDELINPK